MRIVHLLLSVCLSVLLLAGCGGGGGPGGSTAGPSAPYNVWTDSSGALSTTAIAAYAGVNYDFGASGISLSGTDAALLGVRGNEAEITLVDSNGAVLPGWPQNTVSAGGNTVVPKKVVYDGNTAALLVKRLPTNVWYTVIFDANFVNPMSDIPFTQDSDGTDIALDGLNLYYARVPRVGGVLETVPKLFMGNITGGVPISIDPVVMSRKLLIDGANLFVADTNAICQYNKDLTLNTFNWNNPWSVGTSPVIHNIAAANGRIYVAGVSNGVLAISALNNTGTPVFYQEYSSIPITTSTVQLAAGPGGEIYFTVNGRLGQVNKDTGALMTTAPPRVPDGNFVIDGTKAKFVSGMSFVYYDLTLLH